ncbi:MAG: DNA repair protein RadA [Dehalococcoidia bacterium]
MPRATERTTYTCRECGHSTARWEGRCSRCGQWNSLDEAAPVNVASGGATRNWRQRRQSPGADAVELPDLPASTTPRLQTGMGEVDRVFGGGLVPGSTALIAGDPGVGKSTLLLQVAAALAGRHGPVIYATGEESLEQVRMRAERLGIRGDGVYMVATGEVSDVAAHIAHLKPSMVVVDSIQTATHADSDSGAGTVTQIRECAAILAAHARAHESSLLLAGHVTKEGNIAGPRVLEHAVDVVMQMEGETGGTLRLLHGIKNRFGPTDEVGVFEMRGDGLAEVADPSQCFLAQRQASSPGSAVATVMEGTRPITVEIQALVTPSVLPSPRRVATGVDMARLHLIVAVLSKRLRLPVAAQDLVVNVAGGLRVREPAADLAIALAIISSFFDRPMEPGMAAAGEIGLGGELRGVPHAGRRMAEAARLGFSACLIPSSAADLDGGVRIVRPVSTVADAVKQAVPGAFDIRDRDSGE